jgi:hypothetical protein
MKLNAPKKVVWWIALILAVLGILENVVGLPVIGGAAGFWLVTAGYILLFLSTLIKGF